MRRSPFRIAAAALLAALLASNVYRAATQSIVHDEALSWQLYLSGPASAIFEVWDPNNHFLATLLFRVSTSLLGFSGLAMRLPSVLAGALYFWAVFRLCLLLFGEGWVFLIATALLSLNPMVLDFLVAARGYGLGIAALFWALFEITAYLQEAANPDRRRLWKAAGGLSMAVAANLTYLFPAAVLAIACSVFLLRRRPPAPASGPKQKKKQKTQPQPAKSQFAHFVVPIAGLGLLYVLTAPVESASSGDLYADATSALESARNLVRFSFMSGGAGNRTETMALVCLLAAAPLAALYAALAFRARGGWNLLPPVTVIGSALLLCLAHAAAGVPYPADRTGLYVVPLATLSLAATAWTLLSRRGLPRWCGYALLAVCVALVAAFLAEWHIRSFEVWRYDADDKQLFEALESARGSENPVRLGITWQLEPSLNFYRVTRHADWLSPVMRDGLDGDRQFLALTQADRGEIRRRGLRVIYRGPVSGTVLATGR